MKFSFKIQQYQTDAVDAVARVFQGQPYNAGVSYLRDMGNLPAQPQQLSLVSNGDDATQVELQDLINDSGFKNEALQLTDQELLQNIRTLQAEVNIHQSDKLVAPLGRCSLDIEMETGTGKTYVYIKTMFELNKRYGWSKFIVVVPSIAIREGVKKSFEITADHFMECYGKKHGFYLQQQQPESAGFVLQQLRDQCYDHQHTGVCRLHERGQERGKAAREMLRRVLSTPSGTSSVPAARLTSSQPTVRS